ncbi:MAG: XRE family transcriptional regulator [Victivallales bacterium]|jgi:transcriptional regulator with XRE-family HTH domain
MGTMDIALNIRKLREEKGFTLDALAKAARVTKGFLSQVENFRAMPSLPLLYKIAEALEVEPAVLFSVSIKSPRFIFTRKGKATVIQREHPESGFIYKALAKGKSTKTMEPFILEIPANATRKSVCTNGDEFIYILEGNVDFHLGPDIVHMKPGDSLYFEGEIPHFPENKTDIPAMLLVVYSITY